jgi:hypothetical protein
MGWPRLVVVFFALALCETSCLTPPPASQRATDAARELNLDARFGRMDLAVSRTAAGARNQFIERRGAWGRSLRVVDVELAGMNMSDPHQAVVYVDVAWVRMDEDRLRTTRLAQTWRDDEGDWRLMREQRVAGDLGLFGEAVPIERRVARDLQFPSRTIR